MKTPKVRHPFERERVQFATTGETLTHQSMAPECDINRIMAKWQKTGVIEHANQFQGEYGDFADVPTYQEAMNMVINANEMFMTLPSDLRAQFSNDPGQFLEFVSNDENREQMEELGLIPQQKPDGENPSKLYEEAQQVVEETNDTE